METPAPNPKFSSHFRSISLPSISHPLITSAEEQLQRLKSSESQCSSSCASACQKLDGLKKLYELLDDALQLSQNQQVLSCERCSKWEQEVLDGSLRLLDICGSVKDIYLQKKENIQELESSLRRKRGGEVERHMISKRDMNKMISKCYKGLRDAEKKCSLAMVNKDFDAVTLVNMIKKIQVVSLKVLESSLSLVSQSKAGSQPRGWSLVSKLLQHKKVSNKGDSDISAMEKMEVELQLLNDKKSSQVGDIVQMQNKLKRTEALDLNIQELAESLEIVYRILLKTRVSLLNILNH